MNGAWSFNERLNGMDHSPVPKAGRRGGNVSGPLDYLRSWAAMLLGVIGALIIGDGDAAREFMGEP